MLKKLIKIIIAVCLPFVNLYTRWLLLKEKTVKTLVEVENRGWKDVMEDIISEAKDGPEHLFISFDIDVMDPAYMPATGTPEPNGLTHA